FELTADRPIGIALGYEYRVLQGEIVPDPITVAGLTSGGQGEITRGRYHVNEAYAELSIPIAGRIPGIEQLQASAAARVFDYSNSALDWTYQLGGLWRPVHDLGFRAMYSTA